MGLRPVGVDAHRAQSYPARIVGAFEHPLRLARRGARFRPTAQALGRTHIPDVGTSPTSAPVTGTASSPSTRLGA